MENGVKRYDGSWIDDKPSGFGIMSYFNGSTKYEGNFLNGKYNGFGILFLPNYFRFEGNFENDEVKGNGTLYYFDNTGHKQKKGYFNNNLELIFNKISEV